MALLPERFSAWVMGNLWHRGQVLGWLAVAALLGHCSPAQAQIGGRWAYDLILNNSPIPRVTALGGRVVSQVENDPGLALYNPAMLSDSMNRRLFVTYTNSYGGISYGHAGYAHSVKRIGNFHGGITFAGAGQIDRRDATGAQQGTYSANDLALIAGYSREFGPFRAGANVKLVYSNLEAYHSVGMAFDFGAGYFSQKLDLGAGITLRNAGFQFKTYTGNGRQEPLPLELLVGITKGIPRTPFRFGLTFQQLNRPGILTNNPNLAPVRDLNGNLVKPKISVTDQVFAHMIFQLEVLIGRLRNVQVRFAYNHLRRKEFGVTNGGISLAGFSFGLGIRIKMFYLDYGFQAGNMVGNVHQVGLSCYLNKFGKNYKPPTSPRPMPQSITRERPADVAPAPATPTTPTTPTNPVPQAPAPAPTPEPQPTPGNN